MTQSIQKTILTTLSTLILMIGISQPVFAISREGGITENVFARQTSRQLASTNQQLKVEGVLKCATRESGNCTIVENNTGKAYKIGGNERSVRELIQKQNTQVSVVGTLTNDSTIDVQ